MAEIKRTTCSNSAFQYIRKEYYIQRNPLKAFGFFWKSKVCLTRSSQGHQCLHIWKSFLFWFHCGPPRNRRTRTEEIGLRRNCKQKVRSNCFASPLLLFMGCFFVHVTSMGASLALLCTCLAYRLPHTRVARLCQLALFWNGSILDVSSRFFWHTPIFTRYNSTPFVAVDLAHLAEGPSDDSWTSDKLLEVVLDGFPSLEMHLGRKFEGTAIASFGHGQVYIYYVSGREDDGVRVYAPRKLTLRSFPCLQEMRHWPNLRVPFAELSKYQNFQIFLFVGKSKRCACMLKRL